MTFEEGYRDAQKSIADGDAGVREATRVQHNRINGFFSCSLDPVNNTTFMVGLVSGHLKTELGTSFLDCFFDLW